MQGVLGGLWAACAVEQSRHPLKTVTHAATSYFMYTRLGNRARSTHAPAWPAAPLTQKATNSQTLVAFGPHSQLPNSLHSYHKLNFTHLGNCARSTHVPSDEYHTSRRPLYFFR